MTQPIYNAQINKSEDHSIEGGRWGKGINQHKRLLDKKKNQPSLPMKVTDLNSMVQIRKKKPKMKYNDKLAYRQNQER